MLKLFNKEHVAVSALTDLKDYKIEYLLSGEDLVEFSLSIYDENVHLVEEEGYVRNKLNEYVIKAIDTSDNFKRFSCVVNVEDIKAKSIKSFDTSNNNITDTVRLAIAGTGWILADNNITKRRTVRVQNTNALEVLREVRKVFNVDFRFDAINKTIYVYEQFGSDKGVYFSDELNLRSLSIPSDTYDYATRIYPYGKDGLNISSINGGKEYVENYQYSNKIIEVIWEDNRYTVVESLKEDAEAKLEELSKPKRSYQASVSDLAKFNDEYEFLDFGIGDTITLISKTEKFRDKQRIVKYIEYPFDPSKNTCELGNTTLTFEELQRENEAKNTTVDNITSDNGTLDGSKVDGITTEQIYDFEASVGKITDLTVINAKIENLEATNVTITGELNAVKANIGTLNANVATIDSLTVTHTAQIKNLIATSATITDLNATNATISNLEATVGKIDTLVNGNLSSENIQAGGITSDSLTIKNGFITNVMIADLDVSKVNAGDISTNKFRIVSDDGGIEIVGATQQFKDKNNKVRLQLGRDKNNNFTFSLFDETGVGVLIDHTGIKEGAIADDLIVSDMIASDAVGEKQVDYSSFSTGFNKDANTTTLLATKIKLNNQNQTLEVAFNSLKTQADGTKSLTESHSTTIGVMQGQITTAINNTTIEKDGQTILLKDDYNRTVSTVNSMNSTISQHTTLINEQTGKISSVETNVNTISRDLEGTKSTVSSHATQISGLNSTVNIQGSDISQLKTQITLKVEQTDITNAINAEGKITDSKISSAKSELSVELGKVQTSVNSIKNDYATKSLLQQTSTDIIASFEHSTSANLLKNVEFTNELNNWEQHNYPAKLEVFSEYKGFNGGTTVYCQGAQQGLLQKVTGLQKGQKYTFSCFIESPSSFPSDGGIKVWNGKYFEVGSYLSENGNYQDWFVRLSVTFECQGDEVIVYLENKYNSQGRFYATGAMLNIGEVAAPYVPNTQELYGHSIKLNGDGIKVMHTDGSYSHLYSKELGFYGSDKFKRMALKNGYWHLYKWNEDAYMGFIGPTRINVDGYKYGNSFMGGYHCWYHDFGIDENAHNDMGAMSGKSLVRIIYSSMNSESINQMGTHIYNAPLYVHSALNMQKTNIENVNIIRFDDNHRMYKSATGYSVISGYNGVELGYREGEGTRPCMRVAGAIESWANWDFKGYELKNVKLAQVMELEKQQLFQDENISLAEDAVNCILMGGMSTYSNKRNGGMNSMASYLGSQIYKGKLEYDEVISKYPDLKTEIDAYLEMKIKNDGLKFK